MTAPMKAFSTYLKAPGALWLTLKDIKLVFIFSSNGLEASRGEPKRQGARKLGDCLVHGAIRRS